MAEPEDETGPAPAGTGPPREEAGPSAARRPDAGPAREGTVPTRRRAPRRSRRARTGAPPGLDPTQLAQMPSTPVGVLVTCIDYSPDSVLVEEVRDIAEFVGRHRPEWSAVRWINVDGLSDLSVLRALAEKYGLHPLAIEDVLHVPQRPKAQAFSEEGPHQARLFIVLKMMMMLREGQLHTEQVSLFVGHRTVLTFQEEALGDAWETIRLRLRTPGSQLRRHDASFLAYSLLDAVVDEAFPILEHYGDRLEEIEDRVLSSPSPDTIREIHGIKRDLLLLRRAMWPTREVIQTMRREPHECFSDVTRTYLNDVYDHAVQIIDIVETYREIASGLTETYMSALSNRMGEVMKVLTLIGTIFIPLTFLAGVYGMNFRHLPELEWPHGYAMFWGVSLVGAAAMVLWFRRRGWL